MDVLRAPELGHAVRASRDDGEAQKVPRAVLDRLAELACYAA